MSERRMAPAEVVVRHKRALADQRLRVVKDSAPPPRLPLPDESPLSREEKVLAAISVGLLLVAVAGGILAARGGW